MKVLGFDDVFVVVVGLLERITPPGISQIRRISQLAICDILYYMSPLYGSEVRSLHAAMNTDRQANRQTD